MLIKFADKTFLIAFSLHSWILFDLSGVTCGKELAIYSTYLGYFPYIKHTKTKGNEKMIEIGGVRRNR